MAGVDPIGLESAVKGVPGVLGCVIVTGSAGRASEIQAFVESGHDRESVRSAILEVARSNDLLLGPEQILVLEIEPEFQPSGREALARAADLAEQEVRSAGGNRRAEFTAEARDLRHLRPLVVKAELTSSGEISHAEVRLGEGAYEVTGHATGPRSPYGLRVLAEATLEAVALMIEATRFGLKGASLVEVMGRPAVVAVVHELEGEDMVGAALLRDLSVTEATVRATLDAINRRLDLHR